MSGKPATWRSMLVWRAQLMWSSERPWRREQTGNGGVPTLHSGTITVIAQAFASAGLWKCRVAHAMAAIPLASGGSHSAKMPRLGWHPRHDALRTPCFQPHFEACGRERHLPQTCTGRVKDGVTQRGGDERDDRFARAGG